jgi:hypothetical protein
MGFSSESHQHRCMLNINMKSLTICDFQKIAQQKKQITTSRVLMLVNIKNYRLLECDAV